VKRLRLHGSVERSKDGRGAHDCLDVVSSWLCGFNLS
jgi:hypothetical protein